MTNTIKTRLDYLRQEIEQERISYGEIAELESLKKYIDPSDVLLLQWAGVPEFEEEKNNKCFKCGNMFNNEDGELLSDNTTICHDCKNYLMEEFKKTL